MATEQRPTTNEPPGRAELAEEIEHDPTAYPTTIASTVQVSTLREYLDGWVKRIRSGDSGVLPVVGGLIVVVIIFQLQSSVFLSAANLVNLLEQAGPFIMLGLAEVFVLLLGEIDLSIGYSGAVGAAIMTILAAPPINDGWVIAIGAALIATAAIGFIQGQIITRLRLPSFIVTLSGLLFWEGFLIWIINNQNPDNGGSIRITDNVIFNIVNGTLSPTVGWVGMAVCVGLYAVVTAFTDRHRRGSGLVAPPVMVTVAKIAMVAAAGVVLVAICNTDRGIAGSQYSGVPWVVPIVLAFVIAWSFLLGRTKFGRYVYAIGGNAEAARRAGINVRRVRVAAFTLTGLTAGAAMVVYASRLGSMSSDVDGGQLVLYAVAAAVIGGTSLLGGRGKMIHALLGGLMIAAIYNGMGLLNISAAVQYMVTALVLLAAVTVDALARRGGGT
ncbi:MAG: sugar ABC transporter permease [Solirubrobacteraceae bacterium]